jgi:hypothetical protein
MTDTFYHYHKATLPEAVIAAAILYHRQRGQQPQAVIVRPDSGVGVKVVEGLPVEVSETMRPEGHFGVVVEGKGW